MANTVKFHRVLKASPAKVYKAFIDPAALCKWLPPNGFTGTVHSLEAKEGGTYRMSFTNFTTGNSHSFGGTYLELVPGQRIRYTDKLDFFPQNEMITTVTLREVSCGTELDITQEGLPEAIPTEMCTVGWQESLEALARVVEPNIPEG